MRRSKKDYHRQEFDEWSPGIRQSFMFFSWATCEHLFLCAEKTPSHLCNNDENRLHVHRRTMTIIQCVAEHASIALIVEFASLRKFEIRNVKKKRKFAFDIFMFINSARDLFLILSRTLPDLHVDVSIVIEKSRTNEAYVDTIRLFSHGMPSIGRRFKCHSSQECCSSWICNSESDSPSFYSLRSLNLPILPVPLQLCARETIAVNI